MKKTVLDPWILVSLLLAVGSALMMRVIGVDTEQSVIIGLCVGLLGVTVDILSSLKATQSELASLSRPVEIIGDAKEVYEKAYGLLGYTRRSLKAINIGEVPPDLDSVLPARSKMVQRAFEQALEGKYQYKRLVLISNRAKFLWVCRTIEEAYECPDFYVRYVLGPFPYLHLPTLEIFDDGFVIYGFRSAHTHGSATENSFATSEPQLVQFFVRMFDGLWEQARPLKEGKGNADIEELLRIADKLEVSREDVFKEMPRIAAKHKLLGLAYEKSST